MARVNGKCPACGAVIFVNNEREKGHCGQCGVEIDVPESIQLFQQQPAAGSEIPAQPSATSQRRMERERQAEQRMQTEEANLMIQNMFQMCSSEHDYLSLRDRIMNMEVSDNKKGQMLAALDEATKKRLQEVFEKAKKYEEMQESPASIILGAVVIAVIGLAINFFFSMKWPGIIATVIGAMAVIGDIMERSNKKQVQEYKDAAMLLAAYREKGYKI